MATWARAFDSTRPHADSIATASHTGIRGCEAAHAAEAKAQHSTPYVDARVNPRLPVQAASRRPHAPAETLRNAAAPGCTRGSHKRSAGGTGSRREDSQARAD